MLCGAFAEAPLGEARKNDAAHGMQRVLGARFRWITRQGGGNRRDNDRVREAAPGLDLPDTGCPSGIQNRSAGAGGRACHALYNACTVYNHDKQQKIEGMLKHSHRCLLLQPESYL